MNPDESVVLILWHATPFRADKFEDHWRPVAEGALEYGATSWAFLRSKDDPSDFIQLASWRSKLDFDRYWYSEEVAEKRAEGVGMYHVPITPQWLRVVDEGELVEQAVEIGKEAQ